MNAISKADAERAISASTFRSLNWRLFSDKFTAFQKKYQRCQASISEKVTEISKRFVGNLYELGVF